MQNSIDVYIPDLHEPWSNPKVKQAIYDFCLEHHKRIKNIIQVGDLYDMYSATRFARTYNLITPLEETIRARESAELMWITLQQIVPRAKCYQIKGNHDIRPQKKILDKVPELEHLFDMDWLWEFDGVTTIHDPREVLVVNGVDIIHGWGTRPGMHSRKLELHNVVHGHTHKGCVVFSERRYSNRGDPWELDCGFAGDPLSVPFSFTVTKYTGWTPGFGIREGELPYFMELVKGGILKHGLHIPEFIKT